MSCNCKSTGEKIDDLIKNKEESKEPILNIIVSYTLKMLGFLFVLLLMPLIVGVIIWFTFRTIVLNKKVDVKPLLYFIGEKFQNKEEDEDEMEDDELIMEDVEDITNNSNE